MSMAENGHETSFRENFYSFIKELFNIRAGTDHVGTVDSIKANVDFRSANAWTLVFAIFIASVGLNVNSTAVIIGAMLISPLMGPIVGAGFALGTYDFPLLKKSAQNLAAAVVISLMTSMIYFLISPLSEVQSELLARTRPSFFDVLIAFFGGAAGIVAISRKEKGNAIPGVAIATALMPPLCTAGFGLATRNWSYFFGAMYLFVINGVFISISTFLFVRYLKFHQVKAINSDQQRYINRWIMSVGASVLIPSFFMAWYLQQESFFRSQANKYIRQELQSNRNTFVVDRDIAYSLRDPKIKISLLGNVLTPEEIDDVRAKAKNYMIPPDAVEIHQSTLSENLEKKIGEKMSVADVQAERLHAQIRKYEQQLGEFESLSDLSQKVSGEMRALFPGQVLHVFLNRTKPDEQKPQLINVLVQWKTVPNKNEMKRARSFLSERLDVQTGQIADVKTL